LIRTHFGPGWVCREGIWVRGKPVINGYYANLEEILRIVKSWQTKADVVSGLRDIGGFFSIAILWKNMVWAATDKVRSMPLFYRSNSDDVWISDDARWVRSQANDSQFDTDSVCEFLACGYVTGSRTLIPSISQIQAGEVLFVENTSEKIILETRQYYRFVRADTLDNEQDILSRLDDALITIFERIVDWANGRTVVVPLSGGYDSRLIALMLKRLGYNRVLCFSYGRQHNWESAVSREVSKQLDFKWLHVPYRSEDWVQWFTSESMEEYSHYADGLSSVPHIQDWPAVWRLKANGCIPDDSVFMPGHSADFLAGSHTPMEFLHGSVSADLVVQTICAKHYTLNKGLSADVVERIQDRIGERIAGLGVETAAEAVAAYEYWDWLERQAKFICNSVRVSGGLEVCCPKTSPRGALVFGLLQS
jgi:asparagine synthase (glutamine-hydrolysing)